jgi:non-specific serine/threonine protein kinase/serine/threonine-protein kinase
LGVEHAPFVAVTDDPIGQGGPCMVNQRGDEVSSLADTIPVPASSRPEEPEADVPRRIGPYRLAHRIGEGGMGEVWLAEQLEPVRRRVALKVIKAGMETREVVARFESERQALALMDHPAIAKVYDGGTTPDGRPYFVMEYVAGIPITEHCDSQQLSTSSRLELLAEVCEGVQHAHQKAVIHRDLKPSNILVSLVDGRTQPKIIDFGIAKAIGSRLTEKTLFTELGAVIGTPEYMSPEQADSTGQDVDTRTDVYSLGVVLYQLLTGGLPFASEELRSSGYEELRRKLRETEPVRPSTKLSTLGHRVEEVARNRNTEPGALRRQLEGDLDCITLKSLEKERGRRYGTATELAEDLRRHLRHEPVLARPPSAAYRVGKYVKRHRVGVGVATGLAAILVAFAASMAIQARRTAMERDRANRERESAEKASAFLSNMLSRSKPEALGNALWKDLHQRVASAHRGRGASIEEVHSALASLDEALQGVSSTQTALHLLDEEILDRAGKTLEQDMKGEPRLASNLEMTLGATYSNLGLNAQAEQHLGRAVDLRMDTLGPEHPETLEARGKLGTIYMLEGRLAEAEKLLVRVLDAKRRRLGPEHASTLGTMKELATAYLEQGRYEEAEKLQVETLAVQRRTLGSERRETLVSMYSLASAYLRRGRYEDAERLLGEMIDGSRRVLGPGDLATLNGMNALAVVYKDLERYDDAEKLQRETLDVARQALGPEHPNTLAYLNNLAEVYGREGRYEEAEKLQREALETKRRVLGSEHPSTLNSMNNLAEVYEREGRYEEAEKLLRVGLQAQRRVLGSEHPHTLGTMNSLAEVYEREGRYEEAEKLLRVVLATQQRLVGPADVNTLETLYTLANLYNRQGRHDAAEKLAREAVTGLERNHLAQSENMGAAREALGRSLTGLGRYAEAEPELLEAERLFAAHTVQHKESAEALVTLYRGWDKSEPGRGHAAQAARWKSSADAP